MPRIVAEDVPVSVELGGGLRMNSLRWEGNTSRVVV
jgi:hypothetical protein